MNDRSLRSSIISEGERLAVDALYSEKGHFVAATPWRRGHLWLGVPAALFAFAAGAGFVGDYLGPAAASALAFVSGSLSAIATFLNPNETAKSHHNSGTAYGHIRRKLRQFVEITCKEADVAESELRAELAALTKEITDIQVAAKPIPKSAYEIARMEIDQDNGTASYSNKDVDVAMDRI
ncbi:MAG: SLATT domain-containing protein [Roseibium sp.]|uniref:SLATT domain-containing protein n=1 Tax=Roseibium sp. TaxID=1936156 RepID=UPI00262EF449|nr:SLATT domain-containing protein [Roseibium sp.]MCV0428645.1 SLATT domain-containing protein [Roseibium sp.]